MRLKIAIVLAVLGLLVLGTGIGQRTIWLPPSTLTAAVPADVKAAPAVKTSPLTVIGPGVLKTHDGKFTLTVKSDGPIQLAVGRVDDVLGWVDDAAYTTIGGASDDFSELNVASTPGVEKVPNPSGSDLWISEEKATGELTYTWQAPGRGDWALLVSSDGTAPAPIDISVTADNDAATPWAVPLMIIGSALLALAALLFFIAPRKPKQTQAVAGRRAAGRTPADPATGALEVDKIVASRRKRASTAADSTAADSAATDSATKNSPATDSAADAKLPAADATSALPATLTKKDTGIPVEADSKPDATPDSKDDAKPHSKDDSGHDAGSNGGTPSRASAADASPRATKHATKDDSTKGAEKDTAKDAKKNDGKAKFTAPAAQLRTVKNSVKARWGAVLTAALLAGSISPAVAADPTTPAPEPSASVPASEPASGAPAASEVPTPAEPAAAAFPNLLDSQAERIAASVAAVVASGDNAKNAKELTPRVAGMALAVRTSNYKIRAKLAKSPVIEPVDATKMLAKVVTTTRTWPRSAMLVTQGENNELPQLLTLVQESPRENYKLIHATPLLPGQTFPKVDKEGTQPVPLDSAEGLMLSPEKAIAVLSDRLTTSKSKYKNSFNDSVYISSVLDLQKKIVADAKDASYVFSHKGDLDSAVAMRTADGGAMVVVGNNFGIAATSKDEATLKVGEDAAVFTGGRETVKGFTLNYAEPVVMYIPPADGDGKITVLSATRNLVSGKFK